ncbi:hypothetical protein [Haloimpatiens massiliensis]|uniref:hypothetical protein n=1 Tax=Haloimpatiens massiliensis TaxID=1658110 RepID=UPI000C85C5D0|nr:hypothetical protein [Haloimpatiens massiliensis]
MDELIKQKYELLNKIEEINDGIRCREKLKDIKFDELLKNTNEVKDLLEYVVKWDFKNRSYMIEAKVILLNKLASLYCELIVIFDLLKENNKEEF